MFVQCQRDRAVFRIGEWGGCDWTVRDFWVDDESGLGPRQPLYRVSSMFSHKYGLSGEGEMRLTLGIGVARDRNTDTISLSQEEYINNIIRSFGLQNPTTVTTPLEPGAILTKEQCSTTPAELQDMSGNR